MSLKWIFLVVFLSQSVFVFSHELLINCEEIIASPKPSEAFLRIETVRINDCNFTIFPENLFADSFHLRNISLTHNNLIALPVTIFQHQHNLSYLDLSYNGLILLDDSTFNTTIQLVVLRLSYNQLRKISRHLVSGLEHLQELYLDNNNLHSIHMTALDGTRLKVLHLQNNFLDFQNIEGNSSDVERVSPFQNLNMLQVLHMRNNSMKVFLSDWSISNVALKELDLSHNQIEMINFSYIFNIWMDNIRINVSNNQITKMIAAKHIPHDQNQSQVIWILNNNPLKCDCMVIHFARHLRNQIVELVNSTVKYVTDELKCSAPEHFVNQQLQNIPLIELTCPLDKKNANDKMCPEQCSCFVRTIDSAAIFNCSNANLSQIPALPDIRSLGLQHFELHIENNNISTLAMANATGYKSMNRIFAKNNSLETVLLEHLPNDLYALDLSANKLKRINPDVLLKLSHMQNLRNVSFGRNPWICDCVAYELMNFIEGHFSKIVGIDEITCDNDESLTMRSMSGLCLVETATILMLITAMIFALMLVITVIYYKNQQEIMVWMFASNSFSWFFNICKTRSQDIKKYDVFVLCSTLDEEFVTENVLPKLENGRNALKVCSNVREFGGGAVLPEQIAKFVEMSKQTIIFLTPNFIDCFSKQKLHFPNENCPEMERGDVWGVLGFRLAHQNALHEKRLRVIIITKGDIGSIKDYQHEIKAYLKTNIYLRWDENRFFDKLRLAIVHPKYFEPKKHLPDIEQV